MRLRKQLALMEELALVNARASELAWGFLASFSAISTDFGLEEGLRWYGAECPRLFEEMQPLSERQSQLLDALGG